MLIFFAPRQPQSDRFDGVRFMIKLIAKYKELSFREKIILKTGVGLCFSAALAVGKFVIGLLTDYSLCGIAVYTFAILLAKYECLCGMRRGEEKSYGRHIRIFVFLFVGGLLYTAFMSGLFFIERENTAYATDYVILLALISFCELGFALAGLLRRRDAGHYERGMRIINLNISLIAMLTTQMMILDYTGTSGMDIVNAYTGMAVGVFTALCAVYILLAPKITVIGRERNVFLLRDEKKNKLISMQFSAAEITLCRSFVYGTYVYRAVIKNRKIDGKIERTASLWKRMPLILKIICCVLSEILLFVWLFGRVVFWCRSLFLPERLERKMNRNGFVRTEDPD